MTQKNKFTLMKSPLVRALLVLACLFALPIAIKAFPIIPRLILGAIISAMGIGLLIRARKLAVTHRSATLKRQVSAARNIRSVLKMEVEVEIFYLAGLLVGLIAFLWVAIRPAQVTSIQYIFTIAGICLSIAGIADFLQAAYKLTKFAWGRAVGKALLGISATIAYLGAGAMSKSVVASAVGYDPKYFVESVGIFQALLTPVAYIGICATIIAPCCICVVGINMFLGMAAMFWQQLKGMFVRRKSTTEPHIASFPYRLWTGRKYIQPFNIFDWHVTRPIVRPMAILAAACSVLMLISQTATLEIGLRQRFIRAMVVAIDFRSAATCAGTPVQSPAAYAESGVLLIAGSNGEVVRKVCTSSISSTKP